jgi:transducin (beta)-like 1
MECSVPFSLLEPHHCELTGNTFNSEPVSSIKPPTSTATSTTSTAPTSTTKRPREEKKKQKDREKRARRENVAEEEVDSRVKEEVEQQNKLTTAKAATNGSLKDEEMTEATSTEQSPPSRKGTEIKEEDVIVLQGHQSEVFSCAWNPVVTSLLASG